MTKAEKILVIGSNGQLGTELVEALVTMYDSSQIIAADIAPTGHNGNVAYQQFSVLDANKLNEVVINNNVKQIYHLAATLSASGEQNPREAWDLNVNGLLNVLEIAKQVSAKVFWPSSIAVFGATTPSINTPQKTVMEPSTIYGISKQAGEGWCRWYHKNHGVDVRSLRYPGLISYKTAPGGGTTDYAIDIFHAAIKGALFECFLRSDEALPMMYMDDAVRATLELMHAPASSIKERGSYNLAGLSFTPAQLAAEINRQGYKLETIFKPDYRQNIAAAWPDSIDDTVATQHWGWQPEFNLDRLVQTMLHNLKNQARLKKSKAA